MFGAKKAIQAAADADGVSGNELYRRIGSFLAEHHLSPDPGHYAFAYHVLHNTAGPLAMAVARLTDGGVRLTRADIEELGGQVASGGVPLEPEAAGGDERAGLIARAQLQVEGFATMVRSITDETRGFGRDLAASAEQMRRSGKPLAIDEMVSLTAAMAERARQAERRLEAATEEASKLRHQLEEAQGSARRDPLTQLPNRRALEEAFGAAAASGRACLAVCDIDHFKSVNDGFGHDVGDRVLRVIAQALASACAPHMVARHGGEEFTVLFTGVGMAEAQQVLEQARSDVGGRRFRLRETDAPLGRITFSSGLGRIGQDESFDSAFARVDKALYRAKADGRDRLVVVR